MWYFMKAGLVILLQLLSVSSVKPISRNLHSTATISAQFPNNKTHSDIRITTSTISSTLVAVPVVTLNANKFYKKIKNLPVAIQIPLAINIVIWLGWRVISTDVMRKHFTYGGSNKLEVSARTKAADWLNQVKAVFRDEVISSKQWRWWTRFTSSFSHFSLLHLFINMNLLTEIGPTVASKIGNQGFAVLIFMTCLISSGMMDFGNSISLSWQSEIVKQKEKSRPSLGFSAINCALIVLFVASCSRGTYFDVPFLEEPQQPANVLKYLVIFDTIGFIMQSTFLPSPLGHAAHLGGYLSGLSFYVFLMGPKVTTVNDILHKLKNLFKTTHSIIDASYGW